MATEKKINTRIQLKYSTLAEWSDVSVAAKGGNLVLKAGEVGIVAIPKGSSHLQTTPPAIMFKVGDGVTAFKDLPWASALAADVYSWAKQSGITVEKIGTGNVVTDISWSDDKLVVTLGLMVAKVKMSGVEKAPDASGVVDLGTVLTDASAFDAAGTAAAVLGSDTDDANKNTVYGAKAAAAAAQSTANGKYSKPTNGIPLADLAQAVQTSLGKADSALQSHQTITTGSSNGTIAVAGKDVAVKGLAALAYKESLSKSDVGLGNVENKTLDTTVTASSGNYITSGAVKSYVDSAVGAVKQFQYEVVSELPTAAAATMGKIYLVAHSHSTSDGKADSYDEFITIESGTTTKTYSWERIGNTDIDLSQYVKTLSGTANSGVITNLTKSGNTLTVTSTSLEVSAPAASGTALAFIDSVSQAANGKITATKKTVSDATQSAHGLMSATDKAKLDGIAEGANKYSLPVATKTVLGGVKAGTTSGKVYGVDVAADGAMTVSVPWTDHNQTVKVGTSTFGADDAVEIKAGTNVSVAADTSAKTITINGKSDADIDSLITTKINALDSAITGTAGAGKTLTAFSQTDGKVSATFGNISITASQVSDFATSVDARIGNHTGVDKVGTVTSVSAGTGLKVTGTASVSPKIEIDDEVVFVFDCGSATVNV